MNPGVDRRSSDIVRFALIAIAVLCNIPVLLATNVSGTISANTTWTVAGSPYVVTGTVFVQGAGAPVLTIQPGVTVQFTAGTELQVNVSSPGQLQAVGTSALPILFTASGSTTPGFWSGLQFGASMGASSHITYGTVEYGGTNNYHGGIYVAGSSPVLDHVTLRNNTVAGMSVNVGSPVMTNSALTGNVGPGVLVTVGTPSVSSTSITSNSGYAMSTTVSGNILGLTGLTVSGNTLGNFIERQGGFLAASQTWLPAAVPYLVTSALYVQGAAVPVLTIQPGVTVKFNSNTELQVNGSAPGQIQAVGTSALPILFTANGSTVPGFWYGIEVGSSTGPVSHISYATIEYGGTSNYRGGVYAYRSSPVLDHITLRNNAVAGLSIDTGSPRVTNASFSGNPSGVTLLGIGTPSVQYSYWGASSGPSGAGPGTGQSVASGVAYEPWLVAAPSTPEFFNTFTLVNRTFNPNLSMTSTVTAGESLTGSWTVSYLNSVGTTVRTYTGSGVTASAAWDGKNGTGVAQPDGIYTYQLDVTSGSGAATSARGLVVVDHTRQLTLTNLAISQAYFSPNGDGIQDTTVTSGNTSFDGTSVAITIKNSGGTTVRTATVTGLAFSYSWDGKNGSGTMQPDGAYSVSLLATVGTASVSGGLATTLDNTFPSAVMSPSPDGVTFSNVYSSGSADFPVQGTSSDTNMASWSIGWGYGLNPSSFVSFGSGTSSVTSGLLGTLPSYAITNGLLTIQLQAIDKAGNVKTLLAHPTVSNFKLSQSVWEFSAGAAQTITYTSIVPFTLNETITLKNESAVAVRTLISNVPRTAGTYTDVWNGKSASAYLPDGAYFVFSGVTDGVHSATIDLSSVFRTDCNDEGVTIAGPFDPYRSQPLLVTISPRCTGRVSIGASANPTISTDCAAPDFCLFHDRYMEIGTKVIQWVGVDPTGVLRFDIRTMGMATRSTNFAVNGVVVFGTKPTVANVATLPLVFNPGFGTQNVTFDLTSFQNQTVTISVTAQNQDSLSVLRTITVPSQAPGHVSVVWDGRADNGMFVAPGGYTLTVTATDGIGNRISGQTLTTVRF